MTPRPAPPERRVARRALALVAALLVLLLTAALAGAQEEPPAGPPTAVTAPLGADADPVIVPFGELVRAADERALNAAVIDTQTLWVAATDRVGRLFAAEIPPPARGYDYAAEQLRGPEPGALPTAFTLRDTLAADGVTIVDAPDTEAGVTTPRGFSMTFLVVALIAVTLFAVVMLRRRREGQAGGRSGAAGHGKLRASALVSEPAERFGDVAGCDEAVEELHEIVTFLKEPERFSKVGARMPRGVVLHGPPGTGKTLLAKAVAGEAGVPFYAISGSDFVDTFVGVGASRVRDLFTKAREGENGAIIFFDEIDAIGRARGGPGGGGADSEREGTLNQLLVELDGFAARDRVVVIAATNRLDTLDDALLRPGRFDRRVQVGLPAERGRLEILRLHSRDMPIAEPASLDVLARLTAGFAGADLQNVVNEAAIMAARAGRETILASDLDEGMLRAIAGPQRADRRIAEGELEMIAWHEAGHALAAELCPTHAPTQRVTITSRGDTGGLALYGTQDRALTSQQHLHERMVVAMAGRAAEQIRFGMISSGAANDIEMVNRMAREAVERLGFSPEVGQIISVSGIHQVTLSAETRTTIDREVGRLVAAAYADAVALLSAHRDALDALAIVLLEREQLDRSDIEAAVTELIRGARAPRDASRLPAAEETPVPLPSEPPLAVSAAAAPAPTALAEPPAAAPRTLPAPAHQRELPAPQAGGRGGRLRRSIPRMTPAARASARGLRRAGALGLGRALRLPGRVQAFRMRRARRKRPGIV
ncbi:MAG: AAA family ATPase [Miltoncostaeaceae bacterium]